MATLPEGARVLYRKLAFRSVLGFGKYSDLTVSEVIEVLGRPDYLVWVYYNCSNIDFLPDVKAAIGITEEIAKPGVDTELYRRVEEEYRQRQSENLHNELELMSDDERKLFFCKIAAKRKSKAKKEGKRIEEREEKMCGKARLQAWNHGKRVRIK